MFLFTSIACYLATFLIFALILWKFKSPFLRFAGALIAWSTGMVLTHLVGQAEGTRIMRNAKPEDYTSEDFIMSIPDGPNLSAGWIITGWIPLLLAYIVVKKLRPSTSTEFPK